MVSIWSGWVFVLVRDGFDEGEDLAGYVAFQATNDISFAFALFSAVFQVFLGRGIPPQPGQDNAVECRFGLPVTSSVEPTLRCLPGRELNWAYPTEGSKGCLVLHPFWIAPDGDEQRCSTVLANAWTFQKLWRTIGHSLSHDSFQPTQLIREVANPFG